ncbi:class I SAM-dependent methyltransferase [Oculatella sp. LEGE 06141]|uniref:class I SAM-dependent methyltransferase n=1 Tax=Oculatella sp. LEGE 06141 TaxID=1828648 RepID=UPI0018818DF7|nr:class I SAM-dependent methyltransferase [Oculatella sp. LEGE 06141]MBE9182779.1 class I SAM-dependent methyltransferase [Oculatella sp. LEGE 06141]
MQAHPNDPVANPLDGHHWTDYYQAVEGRPPRETLLMALAKFEAASPSATLQFAVDLGCGDGRDTVELLRRGWRVLGIDGEEQAIARLLSRADIDPHHLETRVDRFEVLTLPESVDLINASFCLQFCPPAYFSAFWQKIVTAIRAGGRFCGQLIGDRDSWAAYPHMNHHSREQVLDLLRPFEIEELQEEDHPGKTALGVEKHWHLFHIVARKIA